MEPSRTSSPSRTSPIESKAATCIPIRELARSTSALISQVETDERIFAVSRYGRIVALLIPVPDQVLLEFEEPPAAVRRPEAVSSHEPREQIETMRLSSYERALLAEAASTPTGYWRPAEGRDMNADSRALFQLELYGLLDRSNGFTRITRDGLRVAKALFKERGG